MSSAAKVGEKTKIKEFHSFTGEEYALVITNYLAISVASPHRWVSMSHKSKLLQQPLLVDIWFLSVYPKNIYVHTLYAW